MEPIQINLSEIHILIELAVAMFLGGLIGLDREAREKPAGLRTHILVAGAAALLVSVGENTVAEQASSSGTSIIRTDPIRIIEAVIVGLSFLGAGTIIRDQSQTQVKGLTTAASLLFTGVVGMNIALEEWVVSIGATLLALITLRLLPFVEKHLIGSRAADD